MDHEAIPRSFTIQWRDLDRWSPSAGLNILWNQPASIVKPLSNALVRVVNRVDRKAIELQPHHFISLRFTGEMEQRDVHAGDTPIKGTLYFAEAGDIVYSKIDVRNGAIGIVPASQPLAVVTSEFPVYRVRNEVALTGYIQLVFRTLHFRRIINSMTSGASGRKRVQPEELEKVRIPLPSLDEQQKLVDLWKLGQKSIEDARFALKAVIERLDHVLDTMTNAHALSRQSIALRYSALTSWDVKSARAAQFRIDNPSFRPLSNYAEEMTELVKPWLNPEEEWPVYGVNNTDGVFFSHLQKGKEFKAPYKRISKDWFFHNPTRSSVGSLGVVPDVEENAITSPEYQVWRLRTGSSWCPEFVAALIRTGWFVRLIQVNRVGGVKQRLYVDNLLSMPVPDIPADIRKEVAQERVRSRGALVEATRAALELAKTIERKIVGSKD